MKAKEQNAKIPVNITFLLQDEVNNYDFYLQISTKYVKISDKTHNNSDILYKYKMKGVDQVYMPFNDYERYLKKRLSTKLDIIKSPLKEKNASKTIGIEEIMKDAELVEAATKSLGITDEILRISERLTETNIKYIKMHGNLSEYYKKFSSYDEIKRFKQLLIYISIKLMDRFKMITEPTKNKYILAVMLCDILLEKDDFFISYDKKENITKKEILEHGEQLIKKLPDGGEVVSNDVITFIRQHHERPDGTGYPTGLSWKTFNLYTSIYYVVENFLLILTKHEFRHSDSFKSELIDFAIHLETYRKSTMMAKFTDALYYFLESESILSEKDMIKIIMRRRSLE